jgi:hypothetical protein
MVIFAACLSKDEFINNPDSSFWQIFVMGSETNWLAGMALGACIQLLFCCTLTFTGSHGSILTLLLPWGLLAVIGRR